MNAGQVEKIAGDEQGRAGRTPEVVPALTPQVAAARQSHLIVWLYASGFLVAAIIVAGTVLMLANLRERQLTETKREMQNLALTLAEQIDRSFVAVELVQKSLSEPLEALQLTSNAEFEKRASARNLHQTFKDKIIGLPYIAALTFISAEGKLLNSSVSWPIPIVDVADREYFNVLKSNPQLTSFIGRPVLNRALGTWTIHVARKVRGSKDKFLGLVLATMELSHFEQSFAAVALLPGSSIALLRNDGVLFARHPRIEAAVGQTYTGFLSALAKTDRVSARVVSQIDRQDRLVDARRLAHYPLFIVVGVEVGAALAAWNEGALSILAAAGILMIVITAVVFAGAHQAATRLRGQNLQFDAAINNMGQGLCMFDPQHRIVVCNDRYAQMYHLPPGQVAPGTSFAELLAHRRARGTYVKGGDITGYVSDALGSLQQKSSATRFTELDDGRHIAVVRRPMADGGWVATHTDITELMQQKEALRSQNLRFDAALNTMSQGLIMMDGDERLVVVNSLYIQMYDLSPEIVKPGCTLQALLKHRAERGHLLRDPEEYRADILAKINRGTRSQSVMKTADGREIEITNQPMAGGGWLSTHEDITELRRQEETLRSQNLNFDAAINNMSQGLIMFDAAQRLVVCNDQFIAMYDLSRDVVKPGCTLTEIFRYRADRGQLVGDADQYLNGLLAKLRLGTRTNFVVETKAGREISITNQPMPNGGWVVTHEDITERRKAEAKISHMALHDALTNLPNRLFFREQMETRLAHLSRDQKFAILCLDLDRFKSVNDTLGHPFGDKLLRQVAERMSGCLREGDTIARLGGDEFAILQGGIKQPSDAILLADRLFEAVSAPFDLDGHQVVVGVSIGIAVAPTDAAGSRSALEERRHGIVPRQSGRPRNLPFLRAEMDALMQARRALELDLRKALVNGEFELYYQPLVNLERQESRALKR